MIRYSPSDCAASRMSASPGGEWLRERDVTAVVVDMLVLLDDAVISGGRDTSAVLSCQDLIQEHFPFLVGR